MPLWRDKTPHDYLRSQADAELLNRRFKDGTGGYNGKHRSDKDMPRLTSKEKDKGPKGPKLKGPKFSNDDITGSGFGTSWWG